MAGQPPTRHRRYRPTARGHRGGRRPAGRDRGPPARAELLDRVLVTPKAVAAGHVRHAITLFRGRGADEHAKRSAIVTLAGVLEDRRELLKAELLRKDEGALFQIANESASAATARAERRLRPGFPGLGVLVVPGHYRAHRPATRPPGPEGWLIPRPGATNPRLRGSGPGGADVQDPNRTFLGHVPGVGGWLVWSGVVGLFRVVGRNWVCRVWAGGGVRLSWLAGRRSGGGLGCRGFF